MKLDTFYKTRNWENLIREIRLERDNICEHCHKPIIGKLNCIGHHRKILTQENVNDYNISLNKDNIALVHFKCHNEIHRRFGERKPKVYIVYGSPRAGKTTFVKEMATATDLILDKDNIWQAISINDRHYQPTELKDIVSAIDACVIEQIEMRAGGWHNAYIIRDECNPIELKLLKYRVGGELIEIAEDKKICLQRAENEEHKKLINDYFNDYELYKNQLKEI